MENLEMRKEVLLKYSIPMIITDGKIGRINIKVTHHIFSLEK
jgi:hypothetical protein